MGAIPSHVGEPIVPPPVSPARGRPTEWNELVLGHDDCEDRVRRLRFTCPPRRLPEVREYDGMIRQELGYGVALGVASAWAMMRMISARISAGSRCQASITAVRSG